MLSFKFCAINCAPLSTASMHQGAMFHGDDRRQIRREDKRSSARGHVIVRQLPRLLRASTSPLLPAINTWISLCHSISDATLKKIWESCFSSCVCHADGDPTLGTSAAEVWWQPQPTRTIYIRNSIISCYLLPGAECSSRDLTSLVLEENREGTIEWRDVTTKLSEELSNRFVRKNFYILESKQVYGFETGSLSFETEF